MNIEINSIEFTLKDIFKIYKKEMFLTNKLKERLTLKCFLLFFDLIEDDVNKASFYDIVSLDSKKRFKELKLSFCGLNKEYIGDWTSCWICTDLEYVTKPRMFTGIHRNNKVSLIKGLLTFFEINIKREILREFLKTA